MLWNPLPISHHNGDIVGYVIRVFDRETLTYVKVVEVGVVLSYIVNNLETFHAYNLSIAARTAVGLGPFSNPLHITTLRGGKNIGFCHQKPPCFSCIFSITCPSWSYSRTYIANTNASVLATSYNYAERFAHSSLHNKVLCNRKTCPRPSRSFTECKIPECN